MTVVGDGAADSVQCLPVRLCVQPMAERALLAAARTRQEVGTDVDGAAVDV